jgi:hypothetical protein
VDVHTDARNLVALNNEFLVPVRRETERMTRSRLYIEYFAMASSAAISPSLCCSIFIKGDSPIARDTPNKEVGETNRVCSYTASG